MHTIKILALLTNTYGTYEDIIYVKKSMISPKGNHENLQLKSRKLSFSLISSHERNIVLIIKPMNRRVIHAIPIFPYTNPKLHYDHTIPFNLFVYPSNSKNDTPVSVFVPDRRLIESKIDLRGYSSSVKSFFQLYIL